METIDTDGRIQWIDTAKGIGILFVVLIHCIGDTNFVLNKFILSFDMQLFFFVSGLCSKRSSESFLKFCAKKAKSLLIPQFTMGVIYAVYAELVNILISQNIVKVHNLTGGELSISTGFLKWFLIVLYFVSIVCYWIVKLPERFIPVILFADVIAITIIDVLEFETVIHFEIVPMALLFYLIGYFFKNKINDEKIKEREKGIWIISMPIIAIASYYNIPVEMHKSQYGNPILFVITSIFGIWCICRISQDLDNNSLLCWFGRNSIIVYTLHWVMVSAFGGILNRLPYIKDFDKPYPLCLYNFMLCLILLIPAVYICRRWFWFLFGLKKSRR